MESVKRAARRAAELLDMQEVSGWKLAKLTADRTFSKASPSKKQKDEGRVSSAEWAEAVSAAWGRHWGPSSARNYATAWRRYGENRLEEDGHELSFVEHLWAAEGSEDNAQANIDKHRGHNEARPLSSDLFPDRAASLAGSEPTPDQVVAAVRKNPDVARAIARHDDTREAVEEASVTARAERAYRPSKTKAESDKEIQDTESEVAKSWQDDLALAELRRAASGLARAIAMKEEYGVDDTVKEAELLDRIDRFRAAYGGGSLTDEDQGWLAAQGIAP